MIKKYSLLTDGEKSLSKNFKVKEFACRDGSNDILIDTDLAALLQKIRDKFALPITVNSAYRTPSYNKKVGGVANSRHVAGCAADIAVKGVSPEKIAQFAESVMPNYGGIGLYSTFVHLDTRVKRARWENFGKEKSVSGFYMKKDPREVSSASDAVALLYEKNIISSPEIWYNGTWSDEDFKHLLIKFANYILKGGDKK